MPDRDAPAKILSPEAVRDWVSAQRSLGKQIGFTCGAFDLLHAGHVEYLAEARRRCDALLVAVNSDTSVRALKGELRPINPEQDRLAVVAALQAVDAVTLMAETRPAELIRLLQPDLYIKGGDYSAATLRSKPVVEAYGGHVLLIPIRSRTSTTAILERAALLQLHEKVPAARRSQPPRLVFLDRDGTLIRDVPFLHDPARVELLPGVLEGLQQLQDAGFTLVIVTNQQGIGLGYYSEADFIAVNQSLLRRLFPAGIRIARIYYCPHSLSDDCECRKPGKLLLERALDYFHASAGECFLIGDSIADCQAAAGAGCHAVLVASQAPPNAPCTHRADSFLGAVAWILSSPRLLT
ncbi:MAG: HAD-IIIA family hydrolase [Acidobacteriaceae bacterium]|nr:HAD-IIIA family hydrolase [Acidobacteriaceae bacterium]